MIMVIFMGALVPAVANRAFKQQSGERRVHVLLLLWLMMMNCLEFVWDTFMLAAVYDSRTGWFKLDPTLTYLCSASVVHAVFRRDILKCCTRVL